MPDFEVPREDLALVLSLVERSVAKGLIAPLDHVYLELGESTLTAVGTRSEGSARASVVLDTFLSEEPWTYIVPPSIAQIVSTMASKTVTLSEDGSVLVLSAGSSSFRLPTIRIDGEFPEVKLDEDSEVWTEMSLKKLHAIRNKVAPMVGDEQTFKDNLAITGVQLFEGGWGATEGHRFGLLATEEPVGERKLIVPAKLFQDATALANRQRMKDDDKVSYGYDTNRFAIQVGAVTITSPLINGRQPDWVPAMREAEDYIEIDTDLLLGALQRIEVAVPDRWFLIFTNNAITVAGLNKSSGVSKETITEGVEWPVGSDEDAVVFGFNVAWLRSVLAAAGKKVRIAALGQNEPISVKGDGQVWRGMLYPQRVDDEVREVALAWVR